MVAVRQLLERGVGRGAIESRLRSGRLHRVHRGVYAVGHAALSRQGWWMAAALACGDGAVLSHASAAALWGLLEPLDGPIAVSVPSGGGRARRAGIRVHRRPALASPRRLGRAAAGGADRAARVGGAAARGADGAARAGEAAARGAGGAPRVGRSAAAGRLWTPPAALTVRELIPVTAPWLTVLDLRDDVEARRYRRAVREAERRRFALAPATPTDRTRSDSERDLLALCRRFELPRPEVNVQVGRWIVDFLWRERGLVVEVDSWLTHGGSVAFEDDHQRDLDLRAAGLRVNRYTATQLETEPGRVAADLRRALAPA